MNVDDDLDRLRRQAAAARRQLAGGGTAEAGDGPEPGELYLLAPTGDLPVEWAILDRDPGDPRRLLVVPADTSPMVGSCDVGIPGAAPGGPLTLRCRFGVWLDRRLFTGDRRTRSFDPGALAEARQRWTAAHEGRTQGSPGEREVDIDPEYAEWLEDVVEVARSAVEPTARGATDVAPASDRRLRLGWAVAASVLLAVGFGAGLLLKGEGPELAGLKAGQERLQRQLAEAEDAWTRERLEWRGAQERHRIELGELERRLAEASSTFLAPLTNLPLAALRPVGGARDGGASIPGVLVPEGKPFVLLFLQLLDSIPNRRYRLTLSAAPGTSELWSAELTATDPRQLNVAVPTSMLPPGSYRLRLYDLGQAPEKVVAEYRFESVHRQSP